MIGGTFNLTLKYVLYMTYFSFPIVWLKEDPSKTLEGGRAHNIK